MNKIPSFVQGCLACLVGFAALPVAHAAADTLDSAGFYARQPGQVFKDIAPTDMTVGFVEGQEVPFQTWEGRIRGKAVYVELHGAQLQIKVGGRWFRRGLQSAIRLPAEPVAELDAHGTELYVRPGKGTGPSVLCLESLKADAVRAVPLRSVYVVTNLLDPSPRLYQLPALYGACKGLTLPRVQARARGDMAAPLWSATGSPGHARFQIRYVLLATKALVPTRQVFTATAAGESPDEFTFTPP